MGRLEQRQCGRPRQASRVDIPVRHSEKLQCNGSTYEQHVLEGSSGECRHHYTSTVESVVFRLEDLHSALQKKKVRSINNVNSTMKCRRISSIISYLH